MICRPCRKSPTSPIPKTTRLVIRERAFDKWFANACPGDRLEYHRGHLGADREAGSGLSDRARQELARIADRAMDLALEGRLQLVQERRDEHVIAYLAVMGSARR